MHEYRTHTCGELRGTDVDKKVRLSGWIQNKRDLGGVVFIQLRDNYGYTQLVVNPDNPIFDAITKEPKETVIRIDGKVISRGENVNKNLATGEIEVEVESYELLGSCAPLPFVVFPEEKIPEESRLTYRFLDLRRDKMHHNIVLRSQIIAMIRRVMTDLGFNEFQTPILTSSSPEGARDYLVPSRVHPGQFYALPQAPQQFKQLLMVSGFDRYFQIAPCFRDEDARADRSPGEFYQLDMEMSFATQDDVFGVIEELFTQVFRKFSSDTISETPFPRVPYSEAMLKYGSDKPDLRIPLEIQDVSDIFAESDFKAFAGKTVRMICTPGCKGKSRSFFTNVEKKAKENGAKGLAWIQQKEEGGWKGSIGKFINESMSEKLVAMTKATEDHAMFFCASEDPEEVAKILGFLRGHLGHELGLVEENSYRFCWITDFPMYEKDEETGEITFSHNPFSMPQGGLKALEEQNPLEIKAFQYDIVCNGIEISSGAIRNHRPEIMYKAFDIAGYSQEDVDNEFGGMINALKYGAPPHGGIAPGVDRIVMLLAKEENIREIIAFPFNQNARDLMMGAPSPVDPKQLEELSIRIETEEE